MVRNRFSLSRKDSSAFWRAKALAKISPSKRCVCSTSGEIPRSFPTLQRPSTPITLPPSTIGTL